MDPEMQQLKDDVAELKEMTADTNRVVHKLRRNIWWGRLWSVAWWLFILSVSGAAYYYYAQPLVDRAQQYYSTWQKQAGQAQGWEQQAQQFVSQWFKSPSSQQPPMVSQSGQ